MRLACASMNCPRRAAEKKGETDRTSSWAAKSRCSGPMQRVMMADVKVLMLLAPAVEFRTWQVYLPTGGDSGFFGLAAASVRFAATAWSLNDLFDLLVAFPARLEKLSVL